MISMKTFLRVLKWLTFSLLILVLLAVVFRSSLYRHFFRYESIGHRTSYAITSREIKALVDSTALATPPKTIDDAIDLLLQLTARELHFTQGKADRNPNLLIQTRAANCIGYAAFFSSTCNYFLSKSAWGSDWSAKPLIGHIYLHDYNVHSLFTSPFFKDHDFVMIENMQTGERHFVDPSLYDYTHIRYIEQKK